MSSYFKDGFSAGREGNDPHPPTHQISDPLVGVSSEAVEEMRERYMEGYQLGTQQRAADEQD